jgi:hypothetical protein
VIEAIEERDNNLYRTYFNNAPIPEEERKSGFADESIQRRVMTTQS